MYPMNLIQLSIPKIPRSGMSGRTREYPTDRMRPPIKLILKTKERDKENKALHTAPLSFSVTIFKERFSIPSL